MAWVRRGRLRKGLWIMDTEAIVERVARRAAKGQRVTINAGKVRNGRGVLMDRIPGTNWYNVWYPKFGVRLALTEDEFEVETEPPRMKLITKGSAAHPIDPMTVNAEAWGDANTRFAEGPLYFVFETVIDGKRQKPETVNVGERLFDYVTRGTNDINVVAERYLDSIR